VYFSGAVSVSRRLGFQGFSFLFVVQRDPGLLGFRFGLCLGWRREIFFLPLFVFFFLYFFLGVSSGDFCALYCLCSLIKKRCDTASSKYIGIKLEITLFISF